MFLNKNSPCPGCNNFQALLADTPMEDPASIPKLKQALNIPEITASINPLTNLNSLPDASICAEPISRSFNAPAFPQIMMPITQIASPVKTSRPQEEPTNIAILSFPETGLK